MTDPFVCAACGEPILEDQTVVRVSLGAASDGAFSHALLRPDVYLHAGVESAGPWGDEPTVERWCATPDALARALETAARPTGAPSAHATSGASGLGTYGGE
jgi:hypothetical protein